MSSHSIQALWAAAIEFGACIAIWRLPRSGELHLLIDFSSDCQQSQLDIQAGASGFAISPFVNPRGKKTLLLRPQFHIVFQADETHILSADETPPAFWETHEKHQHPDKFTLHHGTQPDTKCSSDKSHFLGLVNKALQMIGRDKLDKVVAARTLKLPLSENFNLASLLRRLGNKQADAFISLVSIPSLGTWMGASPELLVEINRNRKFRTVSLAGTQAYPADAPLSEAVWKQKEIEEQAMVSRFIVAQFKSIRLREFQETGPRSVRAGSLIHLKTEYHVDINAVPYPDLGDVMLRLLHPTSAICGMPRQAARDFISSHEDLERGLYGGFLGPVNMNGETQLYVNLRCMQLSRSQSVLYAGAGITHDSVAENEWRETSLKCRTLRDVLKDALHAGQ